MPKIEFKEGSLPKHGQKCFITQNDDKGPQFWRLGLFDSKNNLFELIDKGTNQCVELLDIEEWLPYSFKEEEPAADYDDYDDEIVNLILNKWCDLIPRPLLKRFSEKLQKALD